MLTGLSQEVANRMAIQRIGVVGFGQMGSGIAQICAQAGLDTLVREVDQTLVDKGFQRVDGSLARLVKSGRTTEEDAKAARGRLRGTTALADFKDRDLIIEAIVEQIEPKKKLFAELDTICAPTTIFCSNTSSLTIVEMAAATRRPEKFAGLHFFNPPVIMKLVEIVKSITTSEETVAALRDFVGKIGKTGVVCKDTTGFIVNRLMVPYLLGAIRMLELGYPMGPFELIDYTGVDINYHVANVFFDEFKEAFMAPPPLLRRMFLAGQLGTKTGKGFYDYDEQGKKKS